MEKYIFFLFLCFCLFVCGNISTSLSEEANSCESYSNEYDNYIAENINNTNYNDIINEINVYISKFTEYGCSSKLSEAKSKLSEVKSELSDIECRNLRSKFYEDLAESNCKSATINNLNNILTCRQFTEASYKKYFPKFEENNCSDEYKCILFSSEFTILVNNYYSLCKQSVNSSKKDVDSRNVLSNCSEAIFDLEQFYLKVKNYSCKYDTEGSGGDIVIDKNIADEALEIIKKYNEHINELINTGTGGIKSNGIARGLCYAINIISGPFGKAFASLFIILLGMSFLSGNSESMSFKSLISIAFALALIFGAEQLANIISKNVYSCKYIIINN